MVNILPKCTYFISYQLISRDESNIGNLSCKIVLIVIVVKMCCDI